MLRKQSVRYCRNVLTYLPFSCPLEQLQVSHLKGDLLEPEVHRHPEDGGMEKPAADCGIDGRSG